MRLAGAPGTAGGRPAPGRLDAEVEASASGYVVFTEAWMPGWRATVNGEAAPLVRADHVARAVPVPAGTSMVRTRYAPRSLPFELVIDVARLRYLEVALCNANRNGRDPAQPPRLG